MEVLLPSEIVLSAATRSLISDVHELADKVNQFRPLSSGLVGAVHEKLFAERVYSSNAIEGNTLTLRETIEVLRTGYISNRRKREGTEARNLGRAVEHLEGVLLKSAQPHTVENLLALHAILLGDLETQAGTLRNDRRMITGAKHQPPRPELLDDLVAKIMAALASATKVDPVELASWTHWIIARVHPFVDGNGRMARLWQDLVLLRANLAPAIIRLQDRDQNGYYDALAAADDGDLNPLTQLIAQRTASTLEQYVAAQQQSAELTDWAAKIAGEASLRVAEERKAKYLRWSRLMESVRNDFQRCVARITSSGMEVQFRTFPIIDEVAWENLRSGIGAKHTWFFLMEFRHNNREHTYIFFFGKHFWKPNDTDADRREPRVGLLLSEQVGRGDMELLYDQTDNFISLREIFSVENEIIAIKRSKDLLEYERNADGVRLAQEFIEHVLLRRMT